jgi:hypothetical protein
MDKEERIKYDCIKDRERLEKLQKSGKSFLYLSEYSKKNIYQIIVIVAIELLVFTLIISTVISTESQKTINDNRLLISESTQLIKNDFKAMDCKAKSDFIYQYISDNKIYYYDKDTISWLKTDFEDTCK